MLLPPPRSTLFPYTTLFRSRVLQLSPKHRMTRLRLVNILLAERNVPMAAQHLSVLRSEEHTSELQSRGHLVCRLLLEKKKTLHRRTYQILCSHCHMNSKNLL